MLTQPGQWFLDRSVTPWSVTYLANTGEYPPTDTIVIPQSTQVLTATYLQYVTFQGLQFEHDNFTSPSGGYVSTQQEPPMTAAVGCYNCQHVTFNSDIISETAGAGIEFTTTEQFRPRLTTPSRMAPFTTSGDSASASACCRPQRILTQTCRSLRRLKIL